jgi:uncharacterized protein YceK
VKEQTKIYLLLALIGLSGLVFPYATIGQAYRRGPAALGGVRLVVQATFWGGCWSPKCLLLLLHLPPCLVFDALLLPIAVLNEVRCRGVKIEGATLKEMGFPIN